MSPVSSTLDLNSLSVFATVWGISSRFVHVMVVPAVTVWLTGCTVNTGALDAALTLRVAAALTTVPKLLVTSTT